MADGRDIPIRITTSADTSGLDRTEAGVKRLASLDDYERMADKVAIAQWGFYDLDAEISKTGNTIEQTAQGPLQNMQRGATATGDRMRNLGGVMTQAGYQITDFTTQVQMGTSAVTAFAQQAPQLAGSLAQVGLLAPGVGTAVSVGVTTAAIGFQMLSTSYKAMERDLANAEAAAKSFTEQLKFQEQQQLRLRDLTRQEFVAEAYEREAEALSRQVAAMERINALRAAQGNAAAAMAQLNLANAQAGGGNTTGEQGAVLLAGAENQAQALAATLAQTEAKAQQANQDFLSIQAQLREVAASPFADANSPEWKALSERFDQAAATREETQRDLENQRQIYQENLAALEATTAAGVASLRDGAENTLAQEASKALAAIQQKAAETGGQISYQAAASIAQLQEVLADGVIKPEEMARLTEAMGRLRSSREAADRQILEGLSRLEEAGRAVMQELPAIYGRIEGLSAQVSTLSAMRR